MDKRIKVLETISKDMRAYATYFEVKEFNGSNVKKYFDYHGAAISELADIIKSILEEKK